ncbi:MAG: NADH:ubiquinone reductase (Na(+)-transporting) subunit B [Desulfuromonadaceae bacterium]|nr:NADH:ubiquinone reductase (Na(+)-transporting) subunit B [Desulfuromonadaceae bacterium]MDD2855208.1 NADH:ubiquinone reductase (Na(+)-transporting) subunit B [Desulfuromonadaceae bacterium]
MKSIRSILDFMESKFKEGGKLSKISPLFEAIDSFLYSPGQVTSGSVHVRDAMDLKRVMVIVVVALLPCFYMALWNTGFQANSAISVTGVHIGGWRETVLSFFGYTADPNSLVDNLLMGGVWFIPVYLVTNIVGGFWETLFAIIRKHEINEGFLVTGSLFPLICPPTIPLWQVALGISFGVVIGKEIFGGTGKNFMNPALAGRAFLFFAYPAQISGDKVWTAVDGYSSATPLARIAETGITGLSQSTSWMAAFLGKIPGSMGETSTVACLAGALILLLTGVASWRIMVSCAVGAALISTLFTLVGSLTNQMFALPFHWHFVLGGFAFGLVFMTTDPVTGSMTEEGQWIYGALIGFMCILIRVINPAFPEGMMLAILFGNICAPFIDHIVLKRHTKRRLLRHAQG